MNKHWQKFVQLNFFLNHRHYIDIIDLFPESCFEILGYTNLSVLIELKDSEKINKYINNKFTKYVYFSYNRLFYYYKKLSGCVKKQVLIIFNFKKIKCVISIDPLLRKDALSVFDKIGPNTDEYLFFTGNELHEK